MKMIFNKAVYILMVATVFVALGCSKQLDVNHNPNNPDVSQGSPKLVFPAGMLGTIAESNGHLAILGGLWSEYFTQSAGSTQYSSMDSYSLQPSEYNYIFDNLFYVSLKNYQYVIDQSKASSDWTYYLMGTVMKAYSAQILVDLYDQVPYTEALQGAANLNPKFDDGYAIYQNLLKSIDTALGKDLSASTCTVLKKTPDAGVDMIFAGDMQQWKAFANTLKLKMYLRMVNAHPDVAQAGIQALYTSGAQFLTTNASVTSFTDAPSKDNPMYEMNMRSLNTTTNLRASKTMVSWLIQNGDPRVKSFYGSLNPTAMDQGNFRSTATADLGSTVFVQSAVDPATFISGAESYFMQAEAAVRYGSGNAQALYNKGVMAAFADWGLDGTSFVAAGGVYEFPTTGTADNQIEAIITQKWASCVYGCHGIEAFFEKNRTGYPRTSPVRASATGYIPGQLAISVNSVLPAGQLPRRLALPYSETSTNTNAPALVPITTPVWWAKP